MEKTLFQYCIEKGCNDLLMQWNTDKNGSNRPDNVSCFSSKQIWWKCSKGHEWQTPVKVRTYGSNCPICSNKQILADVNDLAATHPELAKEWVYEINIDLDPRKMGSGSKKAVWWHCSQCGYEWKASPVSRCAGRGCPVCAGKVVVSGYNDLLTHYPDIAEQWHPMLNGELTPNAITPFSNQEAWWICKLGHTWKAKVSTRTKQKSDCPYCTRRITLQGFNDLATTHPIIAAQWHPFLNGDLAPCDVMSGSKKKIWWKCGAGHIWQAYIYSRTGNGTGCPVCAGKTNVPYHYFEPAEFEARMMAKISNRKNEI